MVVAGKETADDGLKCKGCLVGSWPTKEQNRDEIEKIKRRRRRCRKVFLIDYKVTQCLLHKNTSG